MKFYTYVLKSKVDGRFYKGLTGHLAKRIKQHNSGQSKSTKGFIPWELVYYECFDRREEARKREKYFKSGVGREYLKSVIGL